MKRFALCLCIVVFAFCLLPFGAADGVDSTETAYQTEDHAQEVNGYSSREGEQPSLDKNAVGSAQTENAPVGAAPTAPAIPAVSSSAAPAAPASASPAAPATSTAPAIPAVSSSAASAAPTTSTAPTSASPAAPTTSTAPAIPAVSSSAAPTAPATSKAPTSASPAADTGKEVPAAAAKNGAASSVADRDGKGAESGETADLTFASIHNKGLTVADGNKWYYENFDRQGRPSFAVLYENGTALEKTEWQYKGNTRHPAQKRIVRPADSEIFHYDEAGRELSIERYTGKTVASKTENVYNSGGKLIEQTVTAGKNIDRSVWEFAGGTAVSQTKYRNGKKTAFIELNTTPHIVHLYMDGKEVYVGEEV